MKRTLVLTILICIVSQYASAQITKSFLQFANHTDLEFADELRIEGSGEMVDAGQNIIEPWQNPNFHKIGDVATVVILDLIFNIYINHDREHWMAKCERFSLTGEQDYSLEIDIKHESVLLFTILYDFEDILLSIASKAHYNIRYPDGTMDVPQHYSASDENGNNPHEANREIMIGTVPHKLIYGTFQEDLDPTKDVLFSLSESQPTDFYIEPDSGDLEDPGILNVLIYNMGILMPFGASDKEEKERAPVAYKALPKNMDVIIFNEFFDPYHSRIILNSLLPWYPYQTNILNSSNILPGIQMGGGVVIVSKFPILEEADYSYITDGDAEVDGINELGNKGVKYARIDKHGQIVHVFGTHMHFEPTDPPNMSQFIYETLIPNRDDIVIMGGDMNVNVFSDNYWLMSDTFHMVEPTYNTFTNKPLQRGTSWRQNHFHPDRDDTGRPRNIDYVFASRDFKVPIVSYNDVQAYRLNSTDRKFWGIFDVGDHQPLYGRFEFPGKNVEDNDVLVCEGDDLRMRLSTTLVEYSVEWYKDNELLQGEGDLLYMVSNISEAEWGTYRCEIIYYYSPDSSINGGTGYYGEYFYPGSYEGRLIETFNVGPDPEVCGIATGLEESIDDLISIFPNPASKMIQVKGIDIPEFQMRIYNAAGESMNASVYNSSVTIPVESWARGMYFLELVVKGEVVTTMEFVLH